MMRLDKFLCEMGVGTRSEVKSFLKKGQVTVNDEIIKKPETKIDENKDTVCFLGQPLSYEAVQYFLLNKPAGCVTATKDNLSDTVMSFLPDNAREDLFPVGRLDKDTEGLLVLTDDGNLAHQLLSPKKHVDKVYFARLDGEVPVDAAERFLEGIQVGQDYKAMPAKLEVLSVNDGISEVNITLREGKFHQVKRMCHEIGCEVLYLKRVSMGNLWLDKHLAPGECRKLTEEEVALLRV